jgi:hypothetical protein
LALAADGVADFFSESSAFCAQADADPGQPYGTSGAGKHANYGACGGSDRRPFVLSFSFIFLFLLNLGVDSGNFGLFFRLLCFKTGFFFFGPVEILSHNKKFRSCVDPCFFLFIAMMCFFLLILKRLSPTAAIKFFVWIRNIVPATYCAVEFRMAFTDFVILNRTPDILALQCFRGFFV